jgi:hypothetical protein
MVNKIKKSILKSLVKERRLTPLDRLSNRLGYMGTGFFITAPHLLPQSSGMVVYIFAGLLSLPQVFLAKQWNLVLVNLNVIFAYLILLAK